MTVTERTWGRACAILFTLNDSGIGKPWLTQEGQPGSVSSPLSCPAAPSSVPEASVRLYFWGGFGLFLQGSAARIPKEEQAKCYDHPGWECKAKGLSLDFLSRVGGRGSRTGQSQLLELVSLLPKQHGTGRTGLHTRWKLILGTGKWGWGLGWLSYSVRHTTLKKGLKIEGLRG